MLLGQVVRMLLAGMIHGDLSEYNILLAADGPMIIDLPQAVDAAGNSQAELMLRRDVDNLAAYFSRFAPQLLALNYGKEIWTLYEAGTLTLESPLTGIVPVDDTPVDLDELMQDIEDARFEEEARLRGEHDLRNGDD